MKRLDIQFNEEVKRFGNEKKNSYVFLNVMEETS